MTNCNGHYSDEGCEGCREAPPHGEACSACGERGCTDYTDGCDLRVVLKGSDGRYVHADCAESPVFCHRCGRSPHVDRDGVYVTIACSDCYDGAEDSSTRTELGSSCTGLLAAVIDWNLKQEECVS